MSKQRIIRRSSKLLSDENCERAHPQASKESEFGIARCCKRSDTNLSRISPEFFFLSDLFTISTNSFKLTGTGTWKIKRTFATEVLAQQHEHFDKLHGNYQQRENSRSVLKTSQKSAPCQSENGNVINRLTTWPAHH